MRETAQTPKPEVVQGITQWLNEVARWRAAKQPPMMVDVILYGLIVVWFLAVAWGNPETRDATHANAGSFFLQIAYFLGFYLLLFSYSRTVSLRRLAWWFYLGLTAVAAASLLAQHWVLTWSTHYSTLLGSWSDKNSTYQASITGPIIEEFFKAAPLLLALLFAWRRKRLYAYSISDWVLLGYAVASGFDLAENVLRIAEPLYGFRFDWPQSALGLLIPIWRATGHFTLFGREFTYVYGTHGTSTGLVALALGLALLMRRRGLPRWVFRLPVATFLWVTVDHGLFNLSLDRFSQLKDVGLIKCLFALWLGGRVTLFGFGLGMFALAAYEARLLHPRVHPEHLRRLGSHLAALGLIIGTTSAALWPRCWNRMLHDRKWLIPIRLPFVTLVWAIFLFNQLLEYVNVHLSFARRRHAEWWLARQEPRSAHPEPSPAAALAKN